jgi:hypothetical protein
MGGEVFCSENTTWGKLWRKLFPPREASDAAIEARGSAYPPHHAAGYARVGGGTATNYATTIRDALIKNNP